MHRQVIASLLAVFTASAFGADAAPPFDAAAAFGARQGVSDLRLSPDGKSVVYIAATAGAGTAVFTRSLATGAKPQVAMVANGNPDRISHCDWVANDRIVCAVFFVVREPEMLKLTYAERLLAVDVGGGNPRILSKPRTAATRGVDFGGGGIIDWLPDQDGAVLMTRVHLPDTKPGSKLGSEASGLAVDRVDTRTLADTEVFKPNYKAGEYLSDGRGNVRIMEIDDTHEGDYNAPTVTYLYRAKGAQQWAPLAKYDYIQREGFLPVAIDPDLDVAYGFRKTDGRAALYSKALDGSLTETLLFARDDVDLDHIVRVGRRHRVVGVSYSTEYRRTHYIDPAFEAIVRSISKALPGNPALEIVDASVDETKLLIFAGADTDAGVYYILDRATHQLDTFLVVRGQLEGVKLATVTPVSYSASDGTKIPAYLTLPPGVTSPKGMPAIVMPHGGPDARDEWGFDWLAQFYAARGFVVLQPNFRGSDGYGDQWFRHKGFVAWPVAIGDVLDGGRWLVSQGVADPAKLAVFGWSYGGYAALQSAVTDPSVFKAVIAVAPVTDLVELREEFRRWSNFLQVSDFVGTGPHAREGSPSMNAAKIKVPVLLVHGTDDVNVNYRQSQLMDKALTAAGVKHEFVTYEHLDHSLVDSNARTELLRKSDAFLRQALGL